MRSILAVSAFGLSCLLFTGCGESGDLKEGAPENVDYNKKVTPAATLPTITPQGGTQGAVPTGGGAMPAAGATPPQ